MASGARLSTFGGGSGTVSVRGTGVITLEGVDLRKASHNAIKNMKNEQRKSNRAVAKKAQDWMRANAQQGTRLTARAARGISGRGSAEDATIAVRGTATAPMALVAFWGAKRHSGWYAAGRYSKSTRQHPKWVGNTWQAAVKGQGPYVINYTLAERLDDIEQLYLDGQFEAMCRAFPTNNFTR